MKEKKRKPLAKRLMALLLIGAMLAPAATPAHAASEDTNSEAAPEVRAVATLIGGQFVEVGLNLDSKEGGKFQSVGVLLTYDPNVLIPIGWGDTSALTIPAASDAASAGKEAAVLPAKGADALSGKLAEAVTVGDKGYLYLSAESARAITGYAQGLPEEKDAESALDPALQNQTANGTPLSYIRKAETAAEYAVVVRFVLKAKPGMELYDYSEIVSALDVIVADDATQSIADSFPLSSVPMTYLADNTDYTTAGSTSPAALKFVWILDGVTANSGTGGGNAEDFVSITLFDWDDKLLGSIVVPKNGDATDTVKQFVQERSATVEQLNGGLYFEDSTLPFTNKRGYSFDMEDYGVWLDYNSDTLTHYGSEVQGVMLLKPTTDTGAVDLTAVKENLILKACYGANSELYIATDTSGYYTTETISTERVAGDIFLINIRVERSNIVNGEKVGVQRLGEPSGRLYLTIEGQRNPLLVTLDNKDVQIIQTAVTTKTDSYQMNVIDNYQVENWTTVADKSSSVPYSTEGVPFNTDSIGSVTNNLGTVINGTWIWTGDSYAANGYMYYGTMKMFNNAVKPGGNISAISMMVLDEMKFNYSMVAAPLPLPVFQAMNTPPLIQKAFNTLNEITEDEPIKESYSELTYKQIQYAIAHNGALLTENIY